MKTTFKRALPVFALVVALLIVLSTAGCETVLYSFRRAFLGATATPNAVVQETPMFTSTPESEATTERANAADSKWKQWLADADKKLPAAVPLNVMFAEPEYSNPSVSPDGRQVLYRHITPDGVTDKIMVRNMQTSMENDVPYPAQGIPVFQWASDSRHVLFMMDSNGSENYSIYSVDIASGKSTELYNKSGVDSEIVSLDGANPKGLYYATNERDANCFDLYWCDITTGKPKLVLQNPGEIQNWYFDKKGNLLLVDVLDDNGGENLMLRTGKSGGNQYVQADWKNIVHWDYSETSDSQLYFISTDGKSIFYTDSTGRNTNALMKMNLSTGAKSLVYANADYDVSDAWLDQKIDSVSEVQIVADRSKWVDLDPDTAKQFDRAQAISDGDFDFTSSSDNDRYWLIYIESDTGGRAYYYVDSQTGASKYLFNENPALKNYTLAKEEPIQYTASDGLTIHGYTTFPVGLDRKNLPMVLLVHGGPWLRDTWGFDEEAQWLANRGYMVLQVNFRGSTGYGKQFETAGDREWGGKMQQDLTDAVNWAVQQGYADKSRVAIMGASYGGYAALAGAAFTPNEYACSVDMFGPSDLITLMNTWPTYWNSDREQLVQEIGDPVKDADFLKSRSPLYSVDKIKIPVLIAQGGNDPRVTPQESEEIVTAMEAKGLYVDYMPFPNAGHGFNTEEDTLKFYTEAGNFLSQYIGGRPEN
jgi:dipeptidyl aminopeptidase/acylaminoacyl peptidase